MENQQDTPKSTINTIIGYTVFNDARIEIKTFFSQGLINALTGNPEEGD